MWITQFCTYPWVRKDKKYHYFNYLIIWIYSPKKRRWTGATYTFWKNEYKRNGLRAFFE